jgi:molybdate transport system substrate-binding protein
MAVVALEACGSGDDPPGQRSRGGVTGAITVSAAKSLTDAFTEIAADFEAAHPDADVTLNFGASSELAVQIEEGAPADVFASADTATMDRLVGGDAVAGDPVPFAENALEIVTKAGNPAGVRDLADLADLGVVALCAVEVPCGKYADEVLVRAEVAIPADRITRGVDVRATLTAVGRGDADAGIVYVTDVAAGGPDVEGVEIPAAENAVATYPIAVLRAGSARPTARAFVAAVVSPAGERVLRGFGFRVP